MLMNITWTYIWSQIFTVIEYVLLGTTYFAKKRKLVVILDTFSMLAGIVAYILLGADLGLAMSVVILLANSIIYTMRAVEGRIISLDYGIL